MKDKDSNFIEGVKLFQKNYRPPKQPLFRIYYDDATGIINQVTDQPSDNKGPYISLPFKDLPKNMQQKLARYIVKNKKLTKWNPKALRGLYLIRLYNNTTITPNKVIYCTVKGQPGILVKSVKTVTKLDFDKYEIYQ